MVPENHWPFGDSSDTAGAHGDARERNEEAQRKLERDVAAASRIAHARMNRLLVGGRAHTRKKGLS